MKQKRLFIPRLTFISTFISLILLCACTEKEGSDPVPPLRLEQNYYEVMSHGNRIIPLTSGSDRISATVGNEAVLRADCYVDEGQPYARVVLHGLQTGNTTLTLTDEVTGVTQTAEVKVTDAYLAYHIDESNHPALQTGITVYLINNEARDCYFFFLDRPNGTLNPAPVAQGSYTFRAQQETDSEGGGTAPNPYLSLAYPTDDDGCLADGTPATGHDFRIDLDGTSADVLSIVETVLGVDWQALIDQDAAGTRDVMTVYNLQLSVPGTDDIIYGRIDSQQIPEHVLS